MNGIKGQGHVLEARIWCHEVRIFEKKIEILKKLTCDTPSEVGRQNV